MANNITPMATLPVNDEDIPSFLSEFPEREISEIRHTLDSFVSEHASHHRPLALVTSGGTVSYLEVRSVRCLDNFSTGLRGAIAVEEFIQRGYAVIHLWREGSASPYARVLSQALGLKQPNHGLNVNCLSRLFAFDADEEDKLVRTVLEAERDPFLTDPSVSTNHEYPNGSAAHQEAEEEIVLNRAIIHSTRMHKALRERSAALEHNRLLTIPFQSVEEYLSRLELASQAVQSCQSLAVIYLAAAVSDFYIPVSERVEHKIQSHGSQELVLKLRAVPKAIGALCSSWAPDAFVVSFKLETDKDILRQKAEHAVSKYGVHLVIGNLLESRHERVWILSPYAQREKHPQDASNWNLEEIVKPRSSDQDSLESSIIDFVVQAHFEFISFHFASSGSSSGLEASQRVQKMLLDQKHRVQRDKLYRQVRGMVLDWAGVVASVLLSYYINVALQRRLRSG